MKTEDYPALFRNADFAAAKCQKTYFFLLWAQYVLLLLASLAGLVPSGWDPRITPALYLVSVCLAALGMLYSTLAAPEKDWYGARAMAESIRTLTWRFMMLSEPFGREKPEQARRAFLTYLSDLTLANPDSKRALSIGMLDTRQMNQITAEMERVRSAAFTDRWQLYLGERIQDQRLWYQSKAAFNYRRARLMARLCICAYGAGILIACWQLQAAGWNLQSLSDPFLVIASGLLGWIQARRYNELAASYNLAAHEIARIEDNMRDIGDDAALAVFVADSESAFSREHTQWTARQNSPSGGA